MGDGCRNQASLINPINLIHDVSSVTPFVKFSMGKNKAAAAGKMEVAAKRIAN